MNRLKILAILGGIGWVLCFMFCEIYEITLSLKDLYACVAISATLLICSIVMVEYVLSLNQKGDK